jgi:lysozyme
MSRLKELLIKHEDIKLTPYRCTSGKLTIGVGHNLDDNGISHEVAMFILEQDIAAVLRELHTAYPWITHLTPARQDALADMAFNLGLPRFSGFKKMLMALEAGDYIAAYEEMLDSRWAKQVRGRARELAIMVLTGEYYGA